MRCIGSCLLSHYDKSTNNQREVCKGCYGHPLEPNKCICFISVAIQPPSMNKVEETHFLGRKLPGFVKVSVLMIMSENDADARLR